MPGLPMTSRDLLELALAAVLLGIGIWLYRRPSPAPDRYGSQGAVLLFIVALILGIHAWGLLDYRPTTAEIEASRR